MPLYSSLHRMPSETVATALRAASGSIPVAARALGVSHATLRSSLTTYHSTCAPLAVEAPRGRPRHPIDAEDARRAVEDAGGIAPAAKALGIAPSTLRGKLSSPPKSAPIADSKKKTCA